MYTLSFERYQQRQTVRIGARSTVEFDNLAQVFERLRNEFVKEVSDEVRLGEAKTGWEQLVLAEDACFSISLFVDSGLYVRIADSNTGDGTQTTGDNLADAIEFAVGWLNDYGFVSKHPIS